MSVSLHSKSSPLIWSIGRQAARIIEQNGFDARQIDLMIGASGGPKWLVLSGLDRALYSDFIFQREAELPTVASSIGSWRFACMALKDPLQGLDRFIEAYLTQQYTSESTIEDISATLNAILSCLLGEQGASEILSHRFLRNHIVTIRSKGLLKYRHKLGLALGLGQSFLMNLIQPRWLSLTCERVVFGDGRMSPLMFNDALPSRPVSLTEANLELALRASGSVPMALEGVENIPQAPPGMYRDGGVTDYHFNARLGRGKGLIFYPHFYAHCVPGWFDKGLKSRHQSESDWDNLIMVSPSPAFVDGLPYRKIPDRKDFFKLSDVERVPYWRRVVAESERLGEAFLDAVRTQQFGLRA